jgi:hypothetical protein
MKNNSKSTTYLIIKLRRKNLNNKIIIKPKLKDRIGEKNNKNQMTTKKPIHVKAFFLVIINFLLLCMVT